MGRPDGREDRAHHGERRCADELPIFYLVDSAGARITDQVADVPRPARRRADLPQPGASCRAGSRRSAACSGRRRPVAPTSRRSATSSSWSRATPRCTWARPAWPKMVIGENVTLEEMGGARMHCDRLGLRRQPAASTTTTRSSRRRRYFSYLPSRLARSRRRPTPPQSRPVRLDAAIVPPTRRPAYDIRTRDRRDRRRRARFFEIKPLFAPELIVGLRPPRRQHGRHRRQQPDGQRRRPVRRLRRQGRPLHLAVRRLQHPAALPRRRARAS